MARNEQTKTERSNFVYGVKKKLVLLSLVLANLVEQPTLEVVLEQGVLRGRVSSDGQVFEYMGIPYSVANETNRFKDPYPPPKWEGIFDATNEHYRCPQRFGRFVMGEEDCLRINVYTPSYTPSKPWPVMVFLHGGGYFENSASPSIYGPRYFVRYGVIIVTLNYRLGALGFLCLGIKDAPGNIGLKDQLAALRWVKKNIKYFAGDPENMTLFGESAGGSATAFLKLTALSQGLFKRTIIQSGSSLGAWSIEANPVFAASRLAKELGFNTTDPYELLEIYKKASLRDLIITDVPKLNMSIVTSRLLFIPCIEKEIPGVENVITEHPFNLLSSGRYNDVPGISGINDREGLFLAAMETKESLAEKDKSEYLPSNLVFDSDQKRLEVVKEVRKLYFGGKTINKETILNLADLYSDVFFIMPTIFEADLVTKSSKNKQYSYLFKYGGYRNIVKFISGFRGVNGASHADELFYMFQSNLLPIKFGTDQLVTDRMTTMWTNFAKYGTPTPTVTEALPLVWIPHEPYSLRFLHIDRDLAMGGLPHPERSQFWNDTYTKFRRKY